MSRLVHLELHTQDLSGACALYRKLLGWRTERLESRWGTYHGLALGDTLDGGIVECDGRRPIWLPYVEVEEIQAAVERAQAVGVVVLLEPREGRLAQRAGHTRGWRDRTVAAEA